jgi:Flp pilus assembly protein TadG
MKLNSLKLSSKMSPRNRRRSGQSLIEFTLMGIPMVFVTISVVYVSIGMWQFHSLAYASEMTARYVSVHGATCAANGNTCTITVGNVATFFSTQAMALDASKVIVQMKDGSGTTTCNPVNSCNSTATQFPSASYNSVGSDITITATYGVKSPLAMFWPPDIDWAHDYTVGAQSRQRIMF